MQVQGDLRRQSQHQLDSSVEDCALLLQELDPPLSTSLLPRNLALPHPATPLLSGFQANTLQSTANHVGLRTIVDLQRPESTPGDLQRAPVEPRTPPAIGDPRVCEDAQLPRDIQSALIEAYFTHSHILYPVIQQGSFRACVSNGSIPDLLLSAVYFAGALHAPESVIHRAGFDARQTCLESLYSKAKALFFANEGSTDLHDQISRVQAAFLLHTMCSSQSVTMDCWTWLGLAIRLAQKIGMHRHLTMSSPGIEYERLWKVIWWSLFVSCTFTKKCPRLF